MTDLINVSSSLICSQTAKFDDNVCSLVTVPKVYSDIVTQHLEFCGSVYNKIEKSLRQNNFKVFRTEIPLPLSNR